MSVYFHSSFNLNSERMSGVLKCLIDEPNLTDEEVGNRFGYKAPFTKRYKSWLKKCGLIENSIKVGLTEYGKVIYQKDNFLNKKQTLWYIHTFLTHSKNNAEVWNYFYNIYLPKNKSFTKSDISEAISMKLMPHNPNHFGKNAPMVKVITKVLIDSYLSKTAFGPLNIIESKEGVFFRSETKNLYKWNSLKDFIKLY